MTRANPDYSNSAINLVNPPEIAEKLAELKQEQALADSLKSALEQTDAWKAFADSQVHIAELQSNIRTLIDDFGSYQSLPDGFYGLKQRKVSLSYDAGKFKEAYPKLAPAVIIETINTSALMGMIKGGIIERGTSELLEKGIAKETESFAYIVRA